MVLGASSLPSSASTTLTPSEEASDSARLRLNTGGMCWAMTMGAGKGQAGRRTCGSVCGPPVEDATTTTLGAVVTAGRRIGVAGRGAGAGVGVEVVRRADAGAGVGSGLAGGRSRPVR